jgi:D-xylose transport system ATP-binding protein
MIGIDMHYGNVVGLRNVNLDIGRNEIVGLVGDNGAGKSTLVKVIAGIHAADTGTIRFAGEEVSITRPQDATELGIATVYQDLALCDNLDVVANLFLGREEVSPGPGTVSRQLDESRMEHQTGELLSNLAVTIPSLRSEVGTLSGGQRQQVAVARSLLGEPKVVLLDEPTAALGVPQTKQVLGLIGRLRERDLGVVVISHNLANVFEVADRIVVLRLGRAAGDFQAEQTTEEHVIAAITGLGNGRDDAPGGNGEDE